jgi:predicted ATPase
LLVLDNCEHVRDAAAAFVALALSVPPDASSAHKALRVLVTSREELAAKGEHTLVVPQLDPPAAMELLFARAQEAVPQLVVDDAARACAERVIEKLDRLPLAIELFAARLDLLTLPELEARLDQPLTVLKRPGGGHATRHADVAAAVRCSWDLLSDDERQVLRACAVFRGGATFETLAAALTRLGYRGALLDDLGALRRKFLLFTERLSGGVRHYLLQTVGAFVEATIEEDGRSDEVAIVHANAVVDAEAVAGRAHPGSMASRIDNLAHALHRCARLSPELAARAGLALHRLMALQGPIHAHLEMLDASIECATASGVADLCRRLYSARGDMRRKVGRVHAAAVDLEEAMSHSEDNAARADVRASQAMLAMIGGDLDGAAAAIDEAIAIADRAEDPRALGAALQRSGAIHLLRGAYPHVEQVCLRALRALEQTDDLRALTNALTYLGIGRLDRGDRPAAREAFTQARTRYVDQGDTWSIAVCDAYLALILVDDGDAPLSSALVRLERARGDAQRVGHARLEAFVDAVLGVAHHLNGDLGEAERCLRRGVGLSLQVKDILAGCVSAGHLAGVPAERGNASLVEARHWLETAQRYAQLMPNPSGRAALVALEGMLARAEGDRASVVALRRRALDSQTIHNNPARLFGATAGADGTGIVGVHLRLALRILDAALAKDAEGPAPVLVIGISRSGRRVSFDGGEPIDFTRRGALRRILRALVDEVPRSKALDVNDLIAAGWPGELVETEAGTARVYTAIKSLRRLGLDRVLVTRDDGYVIAPGTQVRELPE